MKLRVKNAELRAKNLLGSDLILIADSAYTWLAFFDFPHKSARRRDCSIGRMANLPSPQRLRTLALQKRSFDLSCNVVNAYPKNRPLDDASRIIWRQLIKAVTSSTFNLEEADAASSDADFLSTMRIALREAKETRVAIRLLKASMRQKNLRS